MCGGLTAEAFQRAAAEGGSFGFASGTERPPGVWAGYGVASEREGVTCQQQLGGEAAEATAARRRVAKPGEGVAR